MSQTHHIRRRVRDHVVALLSTQVPADLLPTDRVLKSRVRNLGSDELPAILVYTAKEASRRANQDGDLERALDLIIDLRVEGNDDIDDALDDLASAVEIAMGQDAQVGGLALDDAILTGTVIGLTGGEGIALNGSAQMTYAIRLRTPQGMPQGDA